MVSPALTRALEGHGVPCQVVAHPHAERALDEARALGVEPQSVAKTLVVSSPQGSVWVVISASQRLDLPDKVRDLLGAGAKKVRPASEEELAHDYPELNLGASRPLGGRPDPVFLDRRVAKREEIVLEAESHDESVKLRTQDLLRLADAPVVDLLQD